MKKWVLLIMILGLASCRNSSHEEVRDIVTVSIAPFKFFVNEIAGDDFDINVMVQPGANPHVYEPYPEQISRLQKSKAYISNGFLGFEQAWLTRFYEINPAMIRLSLGEKIHPIVSEHHHHDHAEGADPHYWVSPRCAMIMAESVKELLCTLNPGQQEKYASNFRLLAGRIGEADTLAATLFRGMEGRPFMIYHPNLAYLAKDYGLSEVAVEFEGKEPPPSRMKELIDMARAGRIRTIFVQKEYDIRNAKAIAGEIGISVTVIDPLSEDWLSATTEIIIELHKSLTGE
ncbi:MAG: zinc ABC transporter substrate-binding protein [Bacteroidota bacterium]